MTARTKLHVFSLAATFATLSACEEKSQSEAKPASSAKADSGLPHSAGIDKNIAEAVAEVAGGAAPGAASGPPANGVFAPGAADKEIRTGDMPKVALGGKGDGPTVRFGSSLPKKKFDAKIVVSVQTGPRSALPTIELTVSTDSSGSTEAAADKPAGAPTETIFRVSNAKLSSEQPGELPAGVDKQIGKLKGSKYHFEFAPTGGGRLTGIEPPKDSEPDLLIVLETAGDILSTALSPYPSEPVGAGAFWMVTSREQFFGVDRISYRMMKLQRVEGERATIAVSTKHYVSPGRFGLPGLPPHKIGEFNETANGQIVVSVAQPSSVQGENSDVLMANLPLEGQAPPQGMQQGQQIPLHFELRTRIVAGG